MKVPEDQGEVVRVKSIGRVLREARDSRGIPLAEAERATKIRSRYLEALEADDLSSLPGRTYALGFLRSYARYLGLDADTVASLVEEFKRIWPPEATEEPEYALKVPAPRRRAPNGKRRNGAIVLVVAAVVVIALLLPGLIFGPPPAQPPAPSPSIPNQTPEPAPEPSPEPAPEPTPAGVELEIPADKGPSCLAVTVHGEPAYRGLLAQGREISFSGRTSIAVKFGDAGAVSVRLNGQLLGPMGDRGQVLRREFRASTEPS